MIDDTKITDSERDLLGFPAVADILRFGTPVRSNNPERTYKGQAVILSVDPGRQEARVAYAHSLVYPTEWVSLDDIALDLTDATGRAHLAWWMARHPLVAGTDAASDRYPVWRPFYAGNRRWGLDQWGPMFSPAESRGNGCVPSLITLDPNDPRILPDGSRLVDALALSLVGRHLLAGGGR